MGRHHIEDLYFPYSERSFNRHLRFYYGKHEKQISEVSRKTKKAMLGRRISKRKLRERIKNVVVTINKYPSSADISDMFCPKCGCEGTRSTGNMASWPEEWVRTYCARCGYLVGESDNSPYVHVLELMCGPEKDEWNPKYWG